MEIDNFDEILKFVEFKDGEPYIVYIQKRVKDIDKNLIMLNYKIISNVLRVFLVRNKDELFSLKEEIKSICEKQQVRAYLMVTRRITDIPSGEITYEQLVNIYNSVSEDRKVLIDVDDENKRYLNSIKKRVREINGNVDTYTFNTPNGYHIVSMKNFNFRKFKYNFPTVFISTYRSVLLYCNLREAN